VDTYLLAIEVRHDESNEMHTVSSIPTADSLAEAAFEGGKWGDRPRPRS